MRVKRYFACQLMLFIPLAQLIGCGGSDSPQVVVPGTVVPSESKTVHKPAVVHEPAVAKESSSVVNVKQSASPRKATKNANAGERGLANLLQRAEQSFDSGDPLNANNSNLATNKGGLLGSHIVVSEEKLSTAGIHILKSRHLVLYTDIEPDTALKELPEVFDQAYQQWCEYFSRDTPAGAPWTMTCCYMDDEQRFRATGLLPQSIPRFANGYTLAHTFWMRRQSSPYYQRHLMLHEGTHGWMYAHLKQTGPPWYAEGIAELLATHRWQGGKLEMGIYPLTAAEVPRLGRVEMVQKAFAQHRALAIPDVLAYNTRAHLENEPYAWSWALTAFLDHHPRYRQRFQTLRSDISRGNLTRRFEELYARDWEQLLQEWQVYVSGIEYGYDFQRTMVDFTEGKPQKLPRQLTVAANLGWQNSGILLPVGDYALKASGRYQVNNQPKAWWCEPGGVTVQYYRARPLGQLLAAVQPRGHDPEQLTPLATPVSIGLRAMLKVTSPGTLYLRINDSASSLANNSGELHVEITRLNPQAD